MIPKKIHYCWFGGNPLPEDVKRYIESWKKYCPDYELIRWDESNYDVHKNTYVELAYQNKKWAFLTDYARLDIIYEHGGIYLDADVELVHGLDDLLQNNCYMGMEQVGTVNTGLGFGAEPKHPFLRENMKPYEKQNFVQEDGTFKPPICVRITTNLLKEKGLTVENKIQKIQNVTVYPTDYFCPLKMGTNKLTITENTHSIHHYAASWYTGNALVRKIKYYLIPAKIFIKKYILRRLD